MKLSSTAGRLLLVAVFALTMVLSTGVQGFAQGRGHGQDKKAQKFINGHDARDGRWDGRGPRPRLVRRWRRQHRRVIWMRHGHHRRD